MRCPVHGVTYGPSTARIQSAAQESKSMKQLGKQTATQRGFPIVEFTDCYGEKCSLQASSLAEREQPGTSAVWLGVDAVNARVHHSDANRLGVNTNATNGWVKYPIPAEVLFPTRMHLNRGQVQALVNHLQAWLDSDTGTFDVPKTKCT